MLLPFLYEAFCISNCVSLDLLFLWNFHSALKFKLILPARLDTKELFIKIPEGATFNIILFFRRAKWNWEMFCWQSYRNRCAVHWILEAVWGQNLVTLMLKNVMVPLKYIPLCWEISNDQNIIKAKGLL